MLGSDKMLGKIIGISLLLLLIAGIGYGIYGAYAMFANTYDIKGTVVKTWIDPVEGGSAYLVKVRLDNGNLKMLEVAKNPLFMGVNEDLLFTNIEVNKTYVFKCWGWDIEYYWVFATYWYPNIIAVQEAT